MNNFNGIAEFVATVELRTFMRAAEHIGMTSSGVSKSVARLEQRLGVRLLNRSTRSLTLTRNGVLFYQRCRQILRGLQDAEGLVSREARRPNGTLRIDLAPLFGRLCIMPALPDFARQHPDLVVHAVFRRQHVELFDAGMDVAVRVGAVTGTDVTNHRVGTTRYVTCASPSYLARHQIPQRPEDLLQHNCLRYVSSETGQIKDWHFAEGRTPLTLAVDGNLAMGNTDGLFDAAVAGFGIVQVPDYMAASAIQKDLLQPILKNWADRERPISVITPKAKADSVKLRAFINFVADIVPKMSGAAN